jgi:hypothetical protein
MSNILERLPLKRSKKVVTEKMLEIGLIRDKSEVKKKRIRGAKKKKMQGQNQNEEGIETTTTQQNTT